MLFMGSAAPVLRDLILQMAPSGFNPLLSFFLLVSTLPFSHRFSADSTAGKELTFAMIKPDGVSGNHTSEIKKTVLDSGFGITEELLIELDEETVKNFYAEHSSKSFFSSLVQYMIREKKEVHVSG